MAARQTERRRLRPAMVLETRVPTIDASMLELDLYMAVRFLENMGSPILMPCIR